MGNLTITPQWHDTINQVETDEFILGGADGNANLATRQLAENLFWLKNYVMGLPTGTGTTTPTTGGTTTPPTTTPTGIWSFLYATSQISSGEIVKFTAQPIFWYFLSLYFQSDLPLVARLPYDLEHTRYPQYTADGYSNRVLIYVAKQGEQPNFSQLPLVPASMENPTGSTVLNSSYFYVNSKAEVFLGGNSVDSSSGRNQAYYRNIISKLPQGLGTSYESNIEEHWDTYYVFLLDEQHNALLSEADIASQNWGRHHIEKVTMSSRWDAGVGASTVLAGATVNPDPVAGDGSFAAISA